MDFETTHEEGGLGAPLAQPPDGRRERVRALCSSGASVLKCTAGGMLVARPKKTARGSWANYSTTAVRFQDQAPIRAGARRWRARSARASAYSSKDVRAVVIGSDVARGAETRPNFQFRRCSALTRVDGMNAL